MGATKFVLGQDPIIGVPPGELEPPTFQGQVVNICGDADRGLSRQEENEAVSRQG
jgi:hypothetical protein